MILSFFIVLIIDIYEIIKVGLLRVISSSIFLEFVER